MRSRTAKTLSILVLAGSAVILAQQATPPPPPPTDIAGFDNGADPDEPGHPVARLSVASGDVSVKRGDAADWIAGALNAPLMEGDAISVSQQAAAEVQFDNAHFARMAGNTEMRIVQIAAGGDQGSLHRIEIGRGLVTWRVLRDTNILAEISTPFAAIHPLGQASVRIEVMPDSTTLISVRHGEVDVQTTKGTERVREGGLMTVRGTSANGPESDYQITQASAPDRWDTWSDQRDGYLLRSNSPRYVSQDIYGAEDLDPYGQWGNDPQYGNVWTPSVAADWAPYRDGRWVWEDYYGWTWMDSQPWGWAPFHYGTWYQRPGFGWSWYPGARASRTWWRPAMVGFFGFGSGGIGVGFGFGNVGWVPLAPYERYRPWYGRGGFGGGRNVVVNNINITNVYRNARFSNGATSVNARDFERGNYRNRVPVGANELRQASLVRGAGMSPTTDHLRFSDRAPASGGPRQNLDNRRFFGNNTSGNRGASPTVRTPFSQQQAAARSRFSDSGNSTAPGAGRQFGGTQSRQQGSDASPGWSRFGSPKQNVAPQAAPQPAQNPGANQNFRPGNEAAPAQRQENRSSEAFGARRFGGNSGSIDIVQPVVRQRENQNPDQGRRFGAPAARQERAAPSPAPQQQQQQFRPAPQAQRPSGGGGGAQAQNRGGGGSGQHSSGGNNGGGKHNNR